MSSRSRSIENPSLRFGTQRGHHSGLGSTVDRRSDSGKRGDMNRWLTGVLTAGILGGPFLLSPVPAQDFVRGDVNQDTKVDIADIATMVAFLVGDASFPFPFLPCEDATDANDDGAINVADPLFVLNYLFLGGDPPPDPGPSLDDCGPDPTADPLDCEFPLCIP